MRAAGKPQAPGEGAEQKRSTVCERAPRWQAGSLPLADLGPLEDAMADDAWER